MKRELAHVIGGGFAGLVAARVLSDHFKAVVVFDQDENVGSGKLRTGAAQGAHLHVLLKRGQAILADLFPGIEEQFALRGCPRIDWAADTRWESASGRFPCYSSDVQTYSFSRPFLEGAIFARVAARPNIEFRRERVESLRLGGDADLVVLAGGQNFPCARVTGCAVDRVKQEVPIRITYRTVVFATDSLKLDGFKQYYYQMTPPHDPIGGVICPIEGGRSIATVVEYGPPHDLRPTFEDYMDFAARVPGGQFRAILADARPLSGVSVFHKPKMHLRRPDRLRDFPQNVLLLGDTFCSLNPVFGQGMTTSLMQVSLLREMLSAGTLDARGFHRNSASRLRLPFLLSKTGSAVSPGFVTGYLRSYLQRCQQSPKLHRKFLGTLHLENSYGSLIDLPSLQSAVFGAVQ